MVAPPPSPPKSTVAQPAIQAAQQVFPFIILPQFFLAGVFNPIQVLPWYLEVFSRISPMRYAVNLARNVFYLGNPEEAAVALAPLAVNAAVAAVAFAGFLALGTVLFVRSERNR